MVERYVRYIGYRFAVDVGIFIRKRRGEKYFLLGINGRPVGKSCALVCRENASRENSTLIPRVRSAADVSRFSRAGGYPRILGWVTNKNSRGKRSCERRGFFVAFRHGSKQCRSDLTLGRTVWVIRQPRTEQTALRLCFGVFEPKCLASFVRR